MDTCVKGKICRGRGIGRSIVEKINHHNWKSLPILFNGTLNIIIKQPIFLDENLASFILFNKYYLFEAKINGAKCFIFKWKKCPPHIFEIVSPCDLSTYFTISFKKEVKITIDKSFLKGGNLIDLMIWYLVWKYREDFYYSHKGYSYVVNKIWNLKYKILNQNIK
jgi:hypothetical protein